MGISLSAWPMNQQRWQLAVRFYSRWYYVGSAVGVSARRIWLAMNIFYTKQTKKLLYLIFSRKSDQTFCCSENKFREHFNLWMRVKTACSQIHNLAIGMWNGNTKNNKSEIITFKFHLFMLIDDLRCLHSLRMRTAWQTIGNMFSIVSGCHVGIVNVR